MKQAARSRRSPQRRSTTQRETKELDCESAASAFASVADLTAMPARELRRRMRGVNFQMFEDATAGGGPEGATEYVWNMVLPGVAAPIPESVCWFHATRVPRGTTFAEGLLPLPDAAERLSRTLGPARPRTAFQEKISHRDAWGPFGHLVREAAFSPVQNHFFVAPEAVVDLGYDLAAYRAATAPCIVKFRARERRDDVVPLALLYCYFTVWRQPADWDCSTTWSGYGMPVLPRDIIAVEFFASLPTLSD